MDVPQYDAFRTPVFASPLARRIAADKGIDLSAVTGSGPKGRIVKADVEKAQKNIEIQETTNESLLAQARLTEELAKLDREKYMAEGGEYQQSVEKIDGEIKQLEEDDAA